MKSTYCLIIAFLIFSCKNPNLKSDSENLSEQDSANFENIVGVGYLKLTADYDECGEWGGHHEEIKIMRENKILLAEFTKDSIDCENPQSRKVVEKKKIVLTETHKKAITIYLHQLLDKSLQEQIPYHAGQWYSAETIDSTLIINYHEGGNNWKGFIKLREELSK